MSHFLLTSMATNKPKVLAYLPMLAHERLVQFQHEHGLSMSQAVTLVVEDYFGLRQEALEDSVHARLTRLEDVVAKLSDLPDQLSSKPQYNLDSKLLDTSGSEADSLPVNPAPSASATFVPARKQTSQAQQQVTQSIPSRRGWNLYLHHPRGTVEHIAGPFADEEQANSEMNSQMSFGLFPASKGYKWECRKDF